MDFLLFDSFGCFMVLPHGAPTIFTRYYPDFSIICYWNAAVQRCLRIIPHGKVFSDFFRNKFKFDQKGCSFRCDLYFNKPLSHIKYSGLNRIYVFEHAECPF